MDGCPGPLLGAETVGDARYEVAQIARAHSQQLMEEHPVTSEQKAVLRAIIACRTAALGGHLQLCAQCGYQRPHYNSCRNRHCPKCQALAQRRWLQARTERILPVHHFHVVFTLPAELRALLLHNRSRLYALLFETAPQALLQLGADKKHLGAQFGITAVLHTWTRDLSFHPHLHCVVTGGGLSHDGQRWVSTRPQFLLPVRVLASLFAGKFLGALRTLYDRGQLQLRGACQALADPLLFRRLIDKLYAKRWVVYCKPPFGDARAVFAYLGRYTHRVAISNRRLLHVDDKRVQFRTRHEKTATLAPVEFLRRLLLHVLPKGFVRIRHFGLLAASNVPKKLLLARKLVEPSVPTQATPSAIAPHPKHRLDDDNAPNYIRVYYELTGVDLRRCPLCATLSMLAQPLPVPARGPP